VNFERGEVELQCTIVGKLAGAGSKHAHLVTRGDKSIVFRAPPKIAGGKVWGWPMFNMTHDSKFTEPWMKLVMQKTGFEWRKGHKDPLDGAIYLDVTFYETRPKGHFLERKEGRFLRPDAPAYPHATDTHDFDKLRRAISDSLTQARVIADDKRVICGNGWQAFADEEPFVECACIRLGRMLYQYAGELPGFVPPPPVPGQQAIVVPGA